MRLDQAALQRLTEETLWLRDHPEFRERPSTLVEFLGPDHLNIREKTRERIVEVLTDIMGQDVNPNAPTAYPRAMFTGAIGIGKTTVASIVLTYLVHWVLCLKDPQGYFGLLPGSRIAFMMMSTKASQAKEVLFQDVKQLVAGSKWFKSYPIDTAFKNQIRFTNSHVWIVPGDSTETSFEGYNILGGVIDEADSHKITENKDYADEGYRTISNRITSRFGSRGFLLIIGQMKSNNGFAARKYEEFQADPEAYVAKLTLWESFGENYYRDPATGKVDYFWYDTMRKQVITDETVAMIGEQSNMMKIPVMYLKRFQERPEEALKDLAGIPPAVNSPFISLVDRIPTGRQRWIERYGSLGPVRVDGRLEPSFRATNTLPRVCHIDIGYSGEGDALGFAMGHIPEMVEIDGEIKPFIVIDLLYRMVAAPGQEILLGDIRHFIYSLRDDRGFRIHAVTLDGFQSKDTEQQLVNRRIMATYLSVDKEKLPYHDLREAIYEGRIAYPPYEVQWRPGRAERVEILPTELEQLMDTGKKIDHPVGGSKDVADAVAGVVTNLMGNVQYHRNAKRASYGSMAQPIPSPFTQHRLYLPMTINHHAYHGTGMGVPVPPRIAGGSQ